MQTLRHLQQKWPVARTLNNGVTGYIPIDWFTTNEQAVRSIMREHRLRCIYRGPHKSNKLKHGYKPSHTRRCDATHVVLYHY